MAQVWEGIDLRLDRPVAVKLFAGEAVHEVLRARSLREARLAAQFAHYHSVMVYDTGEDDRVLYLVMELVEGPTLAAVLAERGCLEAVEAVAIADQILGAVAAGHRAGLVHRDIKPSNILFTSDGVAKLGDFGIVAGKGEPGHLTAGGKVVGTPRYLSPEQAAGAEVTPACDVYAMGVVLFEMLTGGPPFTGDTPQATAAAHRHAPLPSLDERRPRVDRDVAAVVERALEKSPEARYPDAAAMQTALAASSPARPRTRAFADTAVLRTHRPEVPPGPGPAHAGPPAHALRGRRGGRRRRAAILASLVLLVLLAAVATAVADVTAERDGGGGNPAASQVAPTTAESTTTTASLPTPTTGPDAGMTTEPEITTPPGPGTTTTVEPDAVTVRPPNPGQPTVDTLTAVLAKGPDAHGKSGDKLLHKVQKLVRESGEKRAEEARKRLEDVAKWARKGELDAEIARLATAVFQPLAAPADGHK